MGKAETWFKSLGNCNSESTLPPPSPHPPTLFKQLQASLAGNSWASRRGIEFGLHPALAVDCALSPPPTDIAVSRLKIPGRLGRISHSVSGAYFLLQITAGLRSLATPGLEGGAAFPDSPRGAQTPGFLCPLSICPHSSLWSGCSLLTLNKRFLWFSHNNPLHLGSRAVELCICIDLIFTQQAA